MTLEKAKEHANEALKTAGHRWIGADLLFTNWLMEANDANDVLLAVQLYADMLTNIFTLLRSETQQICSGLE